MPILIAISVLILALFAALGLSGFAVPLTDFLSSFLWHFALASAFLAIIAAFYRSYLSLLFAVLISILTIYEATSYPRVAPQLSLSEKPQKSYSIITFNSWKRSSSEKQLIKYLSESKPDFVFLQEIPPSKFEKIKELQALYPYMHYCPGALCTVLFLSKHPWQSIRAGRAGPALLSLIDVIFGPELQNLRFVLLHTTRPKIGYISHRQQLEWLGEKLGQVTQPLLAGGDINSPPFSSSVRNFTSSSKLKPVGSYLTTWPVRTRHLWAFKLPFTQFGLDQFFANDRVVPLSIERGPDFGSDHLPVIMTFSLKPVEQLKKGLKTSKSK